MSGMFITFEGCEGSGKSTHSEKIYQNLIKKGYPVLLTHEPGGTKISDKIRELLLTKGEGELENIVPNAELMLYLASRSQHIEELILPALKAGKIILCDRFSDATIAYQGYGRGVDMEILLQVNNFVSHNIKPDFTILLDIEPKLGIERSKRIKKPYASEGELDRMESQSIKFHNAVRKGYLEIAKKEPDRVKVFDTSENIDDIFNQIMECILNKIQADALQRSSKTRKP